MSSSSIIAFLFEKVDQVGANMVAKTYQNLASQYAGLMYLFASIYIGFVFLKMKRGHYDANDLLVLVLRMVIILTLALNYGEFCLYIYDVVINEPLAIAHAITINGQQTEITSLSHALDHFLDEGLKAANQIFDMGTWTNPTYLIFGSIIFILVLLSAAFAAGLIILAKCACTILLSLSPLFIFLALFDATKGLFESYLRQLFTYMLVPIMTCAVLMILLSVAELTITHFNEGQAPSMTHMMPLSLMCIIQMYLLLQVKGKCSALSGGFCLPTVISAFKHSKSEWGSVGRNAMNMWHSLGSALPRNSHHQAGSMQVGQANRFNRMEKDGE